MNIDLRVTNMVRLNLHTRVLYLYTHESTVCICMYYVLCILMDVGYYFDVYFNIK